MLPWANVRENRFRITPLVVIYNNRHILLQTSMTHCRVLHLQLFSRSPSSRPRLVSLLYAAVCAVAYGVLSSSRHCGVVSGHGPIAKRCHVVWSCWSMCNVQ